MEDPRTRRDLGVLCIGGVLLVVGLAISAGNDSTEGAGATVGALFAIVGFWSCAICLVAIGVRLLRSR